MSITQKFDKTTKRALLLHHGPLFVEWLQKNALVLRAISCISDQIGQFVASILDNQGIVEAFARKLPDVLSRCNQDTFDDWPTALAYAHVHLVERYKRAWDVLIALTRAAVLPLKRAPKTLCVLDVGSGPGPWSYAVADFYAALESYAIESKSDQLRLLPPRVECVERGKGVQTFLHYFSEYTKRSGPFRADYQDFVGFDPVARQRQEREEHVLRIAREDDLDPTYVSRFLHENEPGWNENLFYDLVVASYFFTEEHL